MAVNASKAAAQLPVASWAVDFEFSWPFPIFFLAFSCFPSVAVAFFALNQSQARGTASTCLCDRRGAGLGGPYLAPDRRKVRSQSRSHPGGTESSQRAVD